MNCFRFDYIIRVSNKIRRQLKCIFQKYEYRFFIFFYSITFIFILPILCYESKYSLFYIRPKEQQATKNLRHENNIRLAESEKYLEMLNKTKLYHMFDTTGEHSNHFDIALTIVSVARNRYRSQGNYQPNYLIQVVAKYLMLFQNARENNIHLKILFTICNVDEDPENYNTVKYLSKFVNTRNEFSKLTFLASKLNILEKEKRDYVFCLNTSLTSNADFILLVEDDAYPLDSLFPVLDYTIKFRLRNRLLHDEIYHNLSNLAYLKLYHPERIQNYLNFLEPDRITELISIGLLSSCVLTVLTLYCHEKFILSFKRIYVSWFIYSILICLVIGRVNIIELLRIHPQFYRFVSAATCCTPAMLFTRKGGEATVEYLSKTTCHSKYPKDAVLIDFMKSSKFVAKMISPNLFKHIGQYSSLGSKLVNPFLV